MRVQANWCQANVALMKILSTFTCYEATLFPRSFISPPQREPGKKEIFFLSNQLIKIELPPWKI